MRWINLYNTTASYPTSPAGVGSTLTATTATWTADANSALQIRGDGYVEFTIPLANTAVAAGLSVVDSATGLHSYTTLDFAIRGETNGTFRVFENNVIKYTSPGPRSAGDVFRVERNGLEVKYRYNGAVFYTSTVKSVAALSVDCSFGATGVSITNVKYFGADGVQDVPWNTPQTSTQAGSTFASFVIGSSRNLLLGDSMYRFSLPTTGIVNTGVVTSEIAPAFERGEFRTVAGSKFAIWESGVQVYPSAPATLFYALNDYFSVERTGTTIQYYQNGSLLYTSGKASSAAKGLIPIGTGPAGSITHCQCEGVPLARPVVFKDVTDGSGTVDNYVVEGSEYVRGDYHSAGTGYAVSKKIIPANGFFDFTLDGDGVLAGLAHAPTGAGVPNGYLLRATTGLLEVVENTVSVASFPGGVLPTDRLEVRRIGTAVTYLKNNVLLYTSALASTGDLASFAQVPNVPASGYRKVAYATEYGSEIPLAWRQLDGTSVMMMQDTEGGSVLQKTRTGAAAYNSDAVSQDWLNGDGSFTFQFAAQDTYVGLVGSNLTRAVSEMKYYVRCLTYSAGAGTFSVAALNKSTGVINIVAYGSFTAADSIRILRKNGVFYFYTVNEPTAAATWIYQTYTVYPDYDPYLVDTSFYTLNSSIQHCRAFFSDSDSDGLDDQWEYEYFGDLTTQTGSSDSDGDGVTNAEEFFNGTDPTQP